MNTLPLQIGNIRSLAQDEPCISIYLHKGHSRLSETVPSISLHREVSYARSLLEGSGLGRRTSEYTKPLFLAAQQELLKDEEATVGLFHSGENTTVIRLPPNHSQGTIVADSFHIKPLIKLEQSESNVPLGTLTAEFSEALQEGQAIHSLYDIVQNLGSGNVKHLLIAEDVILWGTLNRNSGFVVLHPHQKNERDGDILDDLCEWALDDGIQVTVLPVHQIPGQHPALALLNH